MLVVINSGQKHLQQALQQVLELQGVAFITSSDDLSARAVVLIKDEASCYQVCLRDDSTAIQKPARIDELAKVIVTKLNNFCYDLAAAKFYPWRRLVVAEKENLTLTEKESEVLHCLLSSASKSIHKKDLLKEVWGYSEDAETSTVEAHIYRLRNKLATLGLADVIITEENSYVAGR